MDRRHFVKAVSTAAVLSSVLPITSVKSETFSVSNKVIKPRRLKEGDKIAIIAPGSFITEDQLNESIKNLEGLGFKPVYSNRILAKKGYLGGSDQERADDVNEMFGRKDVAGIICARGGYGCARILHLLDYNLIRNNPKVIMGYSDITSLLYGIFANTGLVGFHGPVGISTFNEYSLFYLKRTLFYPEDKLEVFTAADSDASKTYTITSGTGRGELAGGNLSIMVSLIGTKYDIDYGNKIVFIEEIGEEPYRIDRMLTQMIQAGKLGDAAGIAMGEFRNCEPKGGESGITNSFSLQEVLFDRLAPLGIPVVYGLSFGHISNKFTLPIGIIAELNAAEKTITFLESAVT
jgi:muramoyltetrapeptide carboxypeptidase